MPDDVGVKVTLACARALAGDVRPTKKTREQIRRKWYGL